MDVSQNAKVASTSPDRVREVLHNFNDDGFASLEARYADGRPPKFTLAQRQAIKRSALSRPEDYDLPFSTWSLAKLAEFLVAEWVVDDISHEALRALLREEGVSFQRIKTWKVSNDLNFETKKNRALALYAIADGHTQAGPDDPSVIICFDKFGPLKPQPHPGRQWAPVPSADGWAPRPRRRRRRATFTRPHGVRHPGGRLRPGRRQALRSHQAPQGPQRGIDDLIWPQRADPVRPIRARRRGPRPGE